MMSTVEYKTEIDIGIADPVEKKIELLEPDQLRDPLFCAVQLLARSKLHRRWSVLDLRRLVCCPIMIGHCLFLSKNRTIIGYVSWACLTDEMSEHFVHGSRALTEKDWNSGETVWIVDFVGLDGDVRSMSHLIGDYLFQRYGGNGLREARAIRHYPNDKPRRIVKFIYQASGHDIV